MAPPERLSEYNRKRSFDKTPEPAGDGPPEQAGNRFVIQEHHARRLHWDLRLEHDGVLVSWALPRGLPDDPKQNRLAVHTEDHPLEYLTFEGEIPAGEYGGGAMTIWDSGTYETEKWNPREVIVSMHGTRARGRFVFIPRKYMIGQTYTEKV
jgi:bifunctional non-homologous end joining protein LigD